MACFDDHTKFKGVTAIHRDNFSNNVLWGTMDFLQWAFLCVGGFQNITVNPAVSGSLGGDRFRLRRSDDPSYDEGQVWEGFRNDWVWESGITFDSTSPIQVSGVWVDGTFYGPADPTYSHYVDYPNGRIVFDTPVDVGSNVQASFSHRTVSVTRSSEPWFQELMFDSFDIESSEDYLIASSGTRNQLGQTKLQMPVVGIEIAGNAGYSPYQIGGGQWANIDVLFHIFAENEEDRNNIRDALVNQNDKVFWITNRALMKEDADYPLQLDYLGSLTDNAVMYPDLISEYAWRKIAFHNTRSTDMDPINRWLHRSTVRTTFIAVLPEI